MKLALWQPTDESDQTIRECLHDFGDDVLAATWKSADRKGVFARTSRRTPG